MASKKIKFHPSCRKIFEKSCKSHHTRYFFQLPFDLPGEETHSLAHIMYGLKVCCVQLCLWRRLNAQPAVYLCSAHYFWFYGSEQKVT